ncbi:MAG: hypothetical protein CBARDCOR_2511 [uncultured Caballeronia sp.]|nr:MAG: hypothetical protein CBARDCOR_2511 [uncultured Caballeronia sp.]
MRMPFRSAWIAQPERAALAWSAAGNMRQKAGPGLPLHLPILYRNANSNPSGCLPFVPGSRLKGFVHANFRRIFGCFFTGDGAFHGCRGRSAALGVDALLATVSGKALGIDVGLRLPGSAAGNQRRQARNPCQRAPRYY